MKISRIFAVIVAVILYPYLAVAATNVPFPDIHDWNVVSVSRIELRISDRYLKHL